jgi:nucleoside-diphosphate-sugar epimerase
MNDKATHVIIGTGPVGLAVMDELLKQDVHIRVVNRSGQAEVPAGVEVIKADAYDPGQVAEVAAGAAVVYHCANPGYLEWTKSFMPLTKAILEGVTGTGARLVFADNLYGYGPTTGPLTEDLPLAGSTPKTKLRADMEKLLLDAHNAGHVEVGIAKASDFYGPRVLGSHMGDRVFPNLLAGKPAQMFGDPDLPHSFTFIRDFARVLVKIGQSPDAVGQVWHVPHAETLSSNAFVAQAGAVTGLDETKVSAMPMLMMNVLSLFVPILKALKEVVYQYQQPWIVDSSKYEQVFGEGGTPLDEALAETWDWYRTAYQG